MKWAILCISSSFCISFPYLYTTFTKPLSHFLVSLLRIWKNFNESLYKPRYSLKQTRKDLLLYVNPRHGLCDFRHELCNLWLGLTFGYSSSEVCFYAERNMNQWVNKYVYYD